MKLLVLWLLPMRARAFYESQRDILLKVRAISNGPQESQTVSRLSPRLRQEKNSGKHAGHLIANTQPTNSKRSNNVSCVLLPKVSQLGLLIAMLEW